MQRLISKCTRERKTVVFICSEYCWAALPSPFKTRSQKPADSVRLEAPGLLSSPRASPGMLLSPWGAWWRRDCLWCLGREAASEPRPPGHFGNCPVGADLVSPPGIHQEWLGVVGNLIWENKPVGLRQQLWPTNLEPARPQIFSGGTTHNWE